MTAERHPTTPFGTGDIPEAWRDHARRANPRHHAHGGVARLPWAPRADQLPRGVHRTAGYVDRIGYWVLVPLVILVVTAAFYMWMMQQVLPCRSPTRNIPAEGPRHLREFETASMGILVAASSSSTGFSPLPASNVIDELYPNLWLPGVPVGGDDGHDGHRHLRAPELIVLGAALVVFLLDVLGVPGTWRRSVRSPFRRAPWPSCRRRGPRIRPALAILRTIPASAIDLPVGPTLYGVTSLGLVFQAIFLRRARSMVSLASLSSPTATPRSERGGVLRPPADGHVGDALRRGRERPDSSSCSRSKSPGSRHALLVQWGILARTRARASEGGDEVLHRAGRCPPPSLVLRRRRSCSERTGGRASSSSPTASRSSATRRSPSPATPSSSPDLGFKLTLRSVSNAWAVDSSHRWSARQTHSPAFTSREGRRRSGCSPSSSSSRVRCSLPWRSECGAGAGIARR